ncbi:MAG: Ig-like domain-containing protein [Gemmatimonadetes bacterium]|nr:Ig-like domain-containing protein [Gemmatimonadota bacterium]
MRHHLRLAWMLACAWGRSGDDGPSTTEPKREAPATVAAVSPAQVTGTVGQALGTAVTVKVRSTTNQPVPGVAVSFAVQSGGGTASPASATTDAAGQASTQWTLGTRAGTQTLTAAVTGAGSVTFTAVAAPGPASSVTAVAGDGQSAASGNPVPVAPAVKVADAYGNPVPGVAVTFTVTAGGGSVEGGDARTDSSGVARVGRWLLGPAPGMNTLRASITGGAAVTFTAQAFDPIVESVRQRLAGVRLINYYPMRNGWYLMWQNWDPATINADFARIRALGFNAVRIIPGAQVFTVPNPPQAMLERLADVVRMADENGLKVQLTLFDLWGAYTEPGALDACRAWVEPVVRPYRNDPRISHIDLQNEVVLTRPELLAWLKAIFPVVKDAAGDIPVSASINEINSVPLATYMQILKDNVPVDFYDVHYYNLPERAYGTLQRLVEIADGKPLFIGEYGYSTYVNNTFIHGVPFTVAAQEAMHVRMVRSINAAARELQLPTPSPWALYDFLPEAIPGDFHANPMELGFGLVRTDGSEKPAAAEVRALNAGGAIPLDINGDFEDGVGTEPPFWSIWENAELGWTGTFSRDTTVAHGGRASARIDNATGSSSGTPAFFASPIQVLKPGQSYTASVYARGANIQGNVYLTLSWYDVDGNFLGAQSSASLPTGNSDWTELRVTATMPGNARSLQIHLQSRNNPAGTAWFDDLTFH